MDTFFIVVVKAGPEEYTFGPYLEFEQAAKVLENSLVWFVFTVSGIYPESYKAKIQEVLPGANHWQVIATKVEEEWNGVVND